jgi:peroxiredoxin Q/BCP
MKEKRNDASCSKLFSTENLAIPIALAYLCVSCWTENPSAGKMLNEGDMAPELIGLDQDEKPVSLSQYAGRKLVLFFYPQDDTPGCIKEACSLRDEHEELMQAGYEVLGVSADSPRSHRNFIAKYKLPYRLLSDPDRRTIKAYGVLGRKKFLGISFTGIVRTTFLIDERGRIERIIRDVDTAGHARQVLEKVH